MQCFQETYLETYVNHQVLLLQYIPFFRGLQSFHDIYGTKLTENVVSQNVYEQGITFNFHLKIHTVWVILSELPAHFILYMKSEEYRFCSYILISYRRLTGSQKLSGEGIRKIQCNY